jgi:DNA invertase Pin-like site-specific DNA recombinase
LQQTQDMTTATAPTGVQSGYALVSTGHQSLDQQLDALSAAGVDPDRMYRDKLSGTSSREQRPGLAALLDYARPGDAIVVVGIDRLGRNAAEVMATIRELRDRGLVLRSLREGIDSSTAAGGHGGRGAG